MGIGVIAGKRVNVENSADGQSFVVSGETKKVVDLYSALSRLLDGIGLYDGEQFTVPKSAFVAKPGSTLTQATMNTMKGNFEAAVSSISLSK